MAGGMGKRLRPLTSDTPKPLLPVGGVPAIQRIAELLERCGVDEAVITTGYLSEKLEDFISSSSLDMKLSFSKEDIPLGTAGGVKAASKLLDLSDGEPFIVMSGDAVCEIDLSAAFEFGKSRGGDVTIVLSHAKNPFEYGVVLCKEDGEVIRFIEKPSLSHAFSDTVNTGIYIIKPEILELIPDGVSYDFGAQLFPLLLKRSYKLIGYPTDSYWCDIGDILSYYEANMRYTFGDNAIGKGCSISGTAEIEASVIMDNVHIEDGCRIDSAIICGGCIVGKNTSIGRGCVIGSGSIIGQGAVLTDGVILNPGSRIPDGLIMQKSVLFSSTMKASELLSGNGIEYELSSLGSRFPFRLGLAAAEAAAAAEKPDRRISVGVMRSDGIEESGIYYQLLRGLRAADSCDCVGLECGFEAAAANAACTLGLDLSVFVREKDGKVSITFFDRDGLYPHRAFERALISALTKPDGCISQLRNSRPDDDVDRQNIQSKIKSIAFVEEYYLPMLIKAAGDCRISDLNITVRRENAPSLTLTKALSFLRSSEETEKESDSDIYTGADSDESDLTEADINIKETTGHNIPEFKDKAEADPNETGEQEQGTVDSDECISYSLSPSGFDLTVCKGDLCIDMPHIAALFIKDMAKSVGAENGSPTGVIPLAASLPLAVRRLAEDLPSAEYSHCPCDSGEDEARATVKNYPFLKDACFAAMHFAGLIAKNRKAGISLKEMLAELPAFSVSVEKYETESDNMISIMSKLGAPSSEGVFIRYGGGSVRVTPERGGYRLSSEAASGEYAEEIMDISKKKLNELLNNK